MIRILNQIKAKLAKRAQSNSSLKPCMPRTCLALVSAVQSDNGAHDSAFHMEEMLSTWNILCNCTTSALYKLNLATNHPQPVLISGRTASTGYVEGKGEWEENYCSVAMMAWVFISACLAVPSHNRQLTSECFGVFSSVINPKLSFVPSNQFFSCTMQ